MRPRLDLGCTAYVVDEGRAYVFREHGWEPIPPGTPYATPALLVASTDYLPWIPRPRMTTSGL